MKIDFPVEASFWETSVQFRDECRAHASCGTRLGWMGHHESCKSKQNGYLIDARHAGRLSRSPTELAPIFPSWKRRVLACAAASRANHNGRSLDEREPGQEPEAAAKTAAGRPHHCHASSAPERAGNAHQNYERYLALAREAMSNGDRIEAENFYQHAEHYFRVMRDRTN